jgi:hypothetical protein
MGLEARHLAARKNAFGEAPTSANACEAAVINSAHALRRKRANPQVVDYWHDRAMPIGTCRLCLTPGVELQDSHLMPAGVYTLVRGTDANPILVSRTTSIATSRQVRAHLLCADCEERFNKRGEDWTLRNCWHSPVEFPLYEALCASKAIAETADVRIYLARDVPELKIENFVYFGASVFWRAAAHRWSKTPGDHIELGRYESSLRRFLLDEQSFPDRMVLVVMLSASKDEQTNRIMSLPWLAGRSPFHKFRFDIPGITFWLFAGQQIPPECVRTCTAHIGVITICSSADEGRLKTALEMVKNAEVKGKRKN